ncbi:MAG TPA: hypothetical protein VHL80_18535 [Polyangia bacterium]|nr:hypothetical protein [Polyangia bacterium]
MIALSPGMLSTRSRACGLVVLLCAGAAAVTTGGCSFLFVDGPPANAKKATAFSCTTSNGLPVVDGVIAGLAAVSAISAIADGHQTYDPTTGASTTKPDYTTAVGAAAWGALFAASAYVGHSRVSECKEATEELMNRLSVGAPGRGFGPGPVAPGPYAPMPAYDPWAPSPAPPAAPPAPQTAPPAPAPGPAAPPPPEAKP